MSAEEEPNKRWYQLAVRLADGIRSRGYIDDADRVIMIASSGEIDIANYEAMFQLIKHDIPVKYSDYQMLQLVFSNSSSLEDDFVDNDPYSVEPHEAEVFSRLKIADE